MMPILISGSKTNARLHHVAKQPICARFSGLQNLYRGLFSSLRVCNTVYQKNLKFCSKFLILCNGRVTRIHFSSILHAGKRPHMHSLYKIRYTTRKRAGFSQTRMKIESTRKGTPCKILLLSLVVYYTITSLKGGRSKFTS